MNNYNDNKINNYINNNINQMNNNITFEEWKNEINNNVKNEINIDIEDLPDQNYRVLFDNNTLSSRAVSFIILGNFFNYVIDELELIRTL
jgi:hypothetical protein